MLQAKLDTLDADSLAQLLDQIIDIDSFAQFQQRVAECQSLVSV